MRTTFGFRWTEPNFLQTVGSEFINIGNAGHINAVSGHTNWDEGMEILKTLG